jgi:anthranilate synthase component 1
VSTAQARGAAFVSGYDLRTLAAFPDLTALHAAHPERYPFLLESVAYGTSRARYDILFAFPGQELELRADGLIYRDGQARGAGDFLAALEDVWREAAIATPDAALASPSIPFTGGWFVYLGYELAAQIEPTLTTAGHDPVFPVACATRIPAAVIRDHATQQSHLVCEAERRDQLLPQLEADVLSSTDAPAAPPVTTTGVTEEDAQRFLAGVRQVQEYIRAGDVFQVNLSRRWQARLAETCRSIDLYRCLCAANPAPFAGFMSRSENRAVLSSSPERLVSVRNGVVSTRPIAGTYPRSADPEQDAALAQALLRHPKERAEHVMLIDLERNDLGRVCRPGTVRVPELMGLESYRHVHHIVSEVRGELRAGVSPAQVIRAVFPGGTITGCPKVRCMQIISELEQAARGAYTGSMGYINRDGSLDLNILIRTLVRHGPHVSLRAGAGIVADSVPERELEETRVKARGMLAALGAV